MNLIKYHLKMSKKNTKVDNLLSDDSSEDVIVTKTQKKKEVAKRKGSAVSDDSASANMLKNKRKQSKETKKVTKKQVDSDDESEEVKKPAKKVTKKQVESDDESEVKPKKTNKKVAKKADSDDESEEVAKKSSRKNSKAKPAVKKANDSDSDEEVVVKKSSRKNSKANKVEEDEDTHKELFVKNLSYQSTEDSVFEAFSKYGTVVNVKLLTDKFTGKPKGIGFVEFETRADAKKALDGVDVDGRTAQCAFSNNKEKGNAFGGAPRTNNYNNNNNGGSQQQSNYSGDVHTIFVGNLGFKTTENSVRNFFSKVGNVVSCRIAKHEDGRAKGFCHVDFDSADSVQKAIALAGQDLDGREIRVDASQPRQSRGGPPSGGRGGFGSRGAPRGGRGGNFSRPQVSMGSTGTKRKFDEDSD